MSDSSIDPAFICSGRREGMNTSGILPYTLYAKYTLILEKYVYVVYF